MNRVRWLECWCASEAVYSARFLEVDNLTVNDLHAFGLQEFLHQGWGGEVVAAAQLSLTVHYPVGGDGVVSVGLVHRPTGHARAAERKKVRDGTVIGDAAFGDQPCYVVDVFDVHVG